MRHRAPRPRSAASALVAGVAALAAAALPVLAPAPASARAAISPMPLPAPVITTVRPSIGGRSAVVHFGIAAPSGRQVTGCGLSCLSMNAVGGGMKGALIH